MHSWRSQPRCVPASVRRDWPIARDPRADRCATCSWSTPLTIAWSVLALCDHARTTGTGVVLAVARGPRRRLRGERPAHRAAAVPDEPGPQARHDLGVVGVGRGGTVAGYAVVLHVVVLGYLWLRQQRPAGEVFYRKFCSSCAALLSCLVAQQVLHAAQLAAGAARVTGAVPILLVIVVHSCVNRALITGALVCLGVRGRTLLGSRDDELHGAGHAVPRRPGRLRRGARRLAVHPGLPADAGPAARRRSSTISRPPRRPTRRPVCSTPSPGSTSRRPNWPADGARAAGRRAARRHRPLQARQRPLRPPRR